MGRRLWGWLLLGIGFALIVGGLIAARLWLREVRPAPLPMTLANLPRHQQLTGPPAAAEIHRLHPRPFPMDAAGVALYGQGQAVLWVAQTPHPFFARQLVRAMHRRILTGTTPFQPLPDLPQQPDIHQAQGMGQRHFYFALEEWVIWLAVDDDLASQALADTLAFYTAPDPTGRTP